MISHCRIELQSMQHITELRQKQYYPYLDLLKFICCIGIVAIHTRPFYYVSQLDRGATIITDMCVPIFFIISAYFLALKLDIKNGWKTIKKFVVRLGILYIIWIVIMLPTWFHGYMVIYQENWLALLPIKIVFWGAAHGSRFRHLI